MDYQFYPTYPDLARRMWAKFKLKKFTRIMEPSAGNGDLALEHPWFKNPWSNHRGTPRIDCCEIDVSKHPGLRAHGLNVVGTDFLDYGNGAIFSEFILNPPFAEGAKHVLKCWDIAWDAEIVALVNAETVRNPCTQERRRLRQLIDAHGEVEFIENAFEVEEAERKAFVDVALIYLRKEADVAGDITGNLFAELKEDAANAVNLTREFEEDSHLALPNSAVENMVLSFKAAVQAMKASVFAEAKANYYASLLGDTMAVRNAQSGKSADSDNSVDFVRKEVGSRYDELKDSAWASVLRSSNVTSKLSSKAQKRVESAFEEIKKLDYTVTNIYGFLQGILESQGQIQIEMACDVFDLITRYHSKNTTFFRGYKSNDKHRTCGMRIRTTRFVIPGHKMDSWRTSLDWDSERMLADFDKVFSMLDGKPQPQISLVNVFRTRFQDLRNGARVSSSYFDVRLYMRGTIHFFARDKDLVDRFNRLVGRHRQWLPPESEKVSKDFWLQYESAEQLDKEVRKELMHTPGRYWYENPLQGLFSGCSEYQEKAIENLDKAMRNVQERHGINIDNCLEHKADQLLIAA